MADILDENDYFKYYNNLNRITNMTKYPFDLKYKIGINFTPTYKNIDIYYKDSEKFISKPPNKKKNQSGKNPLHKKGGNIMIYFI